MDSKLENVGPTVKYDTAPLSHVAEEVTLLESEQAIKLVTICQQLTTNFNKLCEHNFSTDLQQLVCRPAETVRFYARKNLTNCGCLLISRTSCVRTARPKMSTSWRTFSQLVTSLREISDLLHACSNSSDTGRLQQDCHKVDNTRL